jgi:hypothetical protein
VVFFASYDWRIVSKLNRLVRGTEIVLAAGVVFRFSSRMIRDHKRESKLCASMTRHTTAGNLGLPAGGSTCKGGFAPRCIPLYRAHKAHSHA